MWFRANVFHAFVFSMLNLYKEYQVIADGALSLEVL